MFAAEHVGGKDADRDQGSGDREREHEVEVDHEQRAEKRAGEHCRHGDQATGGVASGSSGDPGVSRDAGEREGEDRGGEVGDREPARRRVLDPHRDCQRHDQGVARILGHRLADDRCEQHGEQH